jgi:stearoyl-CoA desaturase (Delta-9 desaturase)
VVASPSSIRSADAPRPEPREGAEAPRGGTTQLVVTGLIVVVPLVVTLLALTGLLGGGVNVLDMGLLAVGYVLTVFGVTAGYHRLFTHRSFVARRPLKIALAISGSLALEGSLVSWVTNHRRHHQFSDRPGDPHSPALSEHRSLWRGLLHAHVGWLFRAPFPARRRDAADLLVDRDLVVVSKLFPVWVLLTLGVPFALGWAIWGTLGGALTALLWGGVVRIFLVHHVTWSINSICHVWGDRPFRTTDRSRNVGALALVSMGESWHNAHHAFPSLARHGVERRQLDLTASCIRVWERFGWVHSVRWPTKEQLATRRIVPVRPLGSAA